MPIVERKGAPGESMDRDIRKARLNAEDNYSSRGLPTSASSLRVQSPTNAGGLSRPGRKNPPSRDRVSAAIALVRARQAAFTGDGTTEVPLGSAIATPDKGSPYARRSPLSPRSARQETLNGGQASEVEGGSEVSTSDKGSPFTRRSPLSPRSAASVSPPEGRPTVQPLSPRQLETKAENDSHSVGDFLPDIQQGFLGQMLCQTQYDKTPDENMDQVNSPKPDGRDVVIPSQSRFTSIYSPSNESGHQVLHTGILDTKDSDDCSVDPQTLEDVGRFIDVVHNQFKTHSLVTNAVPLEGKIVSSDESSTDTSYLKDETLKGIGQYIDALAKPKEESSEVEQNSSSEGESIPEETKKGIGAFIDSLQEAPPTVGAGPPRDLYISSSSDEDECTVHSMEPLVSSSRRKMQNSSKFSAAERHDDLIARGTDKPQQPDEKTLCMNAEALDRNMNTEDKPRQPDGKTQAQTQKENPSVKTETKDRSNKTTDTTLQQDERTLAQSQKVKSLVKPKANNCNNKTVETIQQRDETTLPQPQQVPLVKAEATAAIIKKGLKQFVNDRSKTSIDKADDDLPVPIKEGKSVTETGVSTRRETNELVTTHDKEAGANANRSIVQKMISKIERGVANADINNAEDSRPVESTSNDLRINKSTDAHYVDEKAERNTATRINKSTDAHYVDEKAERNAATRSLIARQREAYSKKVAEQDFDKNEVSGDCVADEKRVNYLEPTRTESDEDLRMLEEVLGDVKGDRPDPASVGDSPEMAKLTEIPEANVSSGVVPGTHARLENVNVPKQSQSDKSEVVREQLVQENKVDEVAKTQENLTACQVVDAVDISDDGLDDVLAAALGSQSIETLSINESMTIVTDPSLEMSIFAQNTLDSNVDSSSSVTEDEGNVASASSERMASQPSANERDPDVKLQDDLRITAASWQAESNETPVTSSDADDLGDLVAAFITGSASYDDQTEPVGETTSYSDLLTPAETTRSKYDPKQFEKVSGHRQAEESASIRNNQTEQSCDVTAESSTKDQVRYDMSPPCGDKKFIEEPLDSPTEDKNTPWWNDPEVVDEAPSALTDTSEFFEPDVMVRVTVAAKPKAPDEPKHEDYVDRLDSVERTPSPRYAMSQQEDSLDGGDSREHTRVKTLAIVIPPRMPPTISNYESMRLEREETPYLRSPKKKKQLTEWINPWERRWNEKSIPSKVLLHAAGTFDAPDISGVDAALSLSRWSSWRRKNRSFPIEPKWKLSYTERIKDGPRYGNGKIDIYSFYESSTAAGEVHAFDEDPWEYRDVKQRFLHEQSISFSRNWFGDVGRRRGNDLYREPVSEPRSMGMPMDNSPDEGDWLEEWYTTWQQRQTEARRRELGLESYSDDDESCDSATYTEHSGYSTYGDDETGTRDGYGSSVYSEQQRTVRSRRSRYKVPGSGLDTYDEDEESWDDEPPECGTFLNVKQKIGERVSLVHYEHLSSLRHSRWRKKYFPRGSFPYK